MNHAIIDPELVRAHLFPSDKSSVKVSERMDWLFSEISAEQIL